MSHGESSPPKAAANDENSALSVLKALLLGQEKASIERIEQELHSPAVQTEKVADSLPGSLHRAYRENPAELAGALDRPVAECIRGSVRRDPGFFADALYPAMGPAIRRSITQALRDLVQQINRGLEHSFTLKGLKWRLEAARSGVSFAEVVLRHTLRYRVEEVFLIQSGSGLLVQHLSQVTDGERDADAVSAMLTAIRDFARDALDHEGSRGTRLDTIDAGEHTLWLIHGPHAYLACAIRGVAPPGLRDELAGVLEQLHRQHGALLADFDGDQARAAVLHPLLQPCLRSEVAEGGGRGFPWPLAWLSLLLLGLLGWWGVTQWQAATAARLLQERQATAVQRLSAEPGTLVTHWHNDAGSLVIEGLHDPLGEPPGTVLAAAGLQAAEYRLALRPFQSAEQAIAFRRALQRLQPPASVRLSLDTGGVLRAGGVAPAGWLERAQLLATTVPGIERLDAEGVMDGDEHLRRLLLERLAPPPEVQLTVHDGQARLAGQAPLDWIRQLPRRLAGIEGLQAADSAGLRAVEAARLDELHALIEGIQVYFFGGAELDDGQRRRLRDLAVLVDEAGRLGEALGHRLRLQVIGRTDGTGTPEQNRFIAEQRAGTVAAMLRDAAPGLAEIETVTSTQPPSRPEPDAALRRAEFRLLGMPVPEAGGTRR